MAVNLLLLLYLLLNLRQPVGVLGQVLGLSLLQVVLPHQHLLRNRLQLVNLLPPRHLKVVVLLSLLRNLRQFLHLPALVKVYHPLHQRLNR